MKWIFGILLLYFFGCNNATYKYQISGWIDTNEGLKCTFWNTDIINFDGDTIYYSNSDRSEVRIYPPYKIRKNK